MRLLCSPNGELSGQLEAWPSKPEMQRLIVAASLARGFSKISNFRSNFETELMLRACESLLGARFAVAGSAMTVAGERTWKDVRGLIDCDGSALVARVAVAIASATPGSVRITGNPVLCARPMAPLFGALENLGGVFQYAGAERCLPVTVASEIAGGGQSTLPGGISSQFVTALLLAAPLLAEGLRLGITGTLVSPSYVAMTLAAQRLAGIRVDVSRPATYVVGAQEYQPFEADVGPDYTSCSYFMAAAAISGGKVAVSGLDKATLQGEQAIVDILRRMGAIVEIRDSICVIAGTGGLCGDLSIDATDCPNIIPTLAALAAVAEGTMVVTGGRVTNFHKSPRIAALVEEVRRVGVEAEAILENGLTVGFSITGRPELAGDVVLDAREDHRVAKALSLLSLRSRGPLTITGIDTQVALLRRFVTECSELGHNIDLIP